jgi:hypothetical protein
MTNRREYLDSFIMPVSYFCLVGALYAKNGYYNWLSLTLLGATVVLSYYYYYRYYLRPKAHPERNPAWMKTGFVTLFVVIVFIMSAARYFLPKIPSLSLKIAFILLLAAEVALILRPKKGSLYLLCLLVFSHNIIYSLSLGAPPIDVYQFINEGARCILNLHNPYTHVYPQIYAGADIQLLYGNLPGISHGIAFQPYMPLSLLLSVPGALLGDVRIVNIAAFAATPIFIYLIVREMLPETDDRIKRLLSAIPLFFPIQGHFLFQAWNDVFPGLFFVLFIYGIIRKLPLLSYASLAIMIGLKQYTAFFVLPLLFLLDFKDYKLYLAMLIFLAVPLAVFGIADMHALTNSLVVFHLHQPFRPESLSLASFLSKVFGVRIFNPGPYFTVLASANIAFLFLKKGKASDCAGAIFSSYILFSIFLLLSKQSFANYYYVLSIMLFSSLVMSLSRLSWIRHCTQEVFTLKA